MIHCTAKWVNIMPIGNVWLHTKTTCCVEAMWKTRKKSLIPDFIGPFFLFCRSACYRQPGRSLTFSFFLFIAWFGWVKRLNDISLIVSSFFPAAGEVSSSLLYEWRTIPCYLLVQPPSFPTSSPVFYQCSLFFPCCGAYWWRVQGEELSASVGELQSTCWEAYAALRLWGGSECGSQSYAGNARLCFARGRTGGAHNSI